PPKADIDVARHGAAGRRKKRRSRPLITLNRKTVEHTGPLVVGLLRAALVLGGRFRLCPFFWHFDPHVSGVLWGGFCPRLTCRRLNLRQSFIRRRLGLSIKYISRCHVRRRCRRSSKSIYRIVIMGL